jgi:2-polyprenyl-6-methoxyphenol hydroxylase-like FAD-dependent oxidoreductase
MAVPNFFRRPFGPGWALVGDAGYNKDFITAQGISDAFHDAESCGTALRESFEGLHSFNDAMTAYQTARDQRVRALYEFTCEFASYTPPTPEKLQLLAAIHGNREAMDGFARVVAGVISPAQFFSPENIGRILAAAQA